MIRLILGFLFFVFFQVLFLANLSLYNIPTPYLYILFIIMLPPNFSLFWLFAVSFAMGLSIDFFSNSLGLHTSACVFLAFARTLLLRFMRPEDDKNSMIITIKNTSFRWFFIYSFILTALHHIFLFNMELFKIHDIPSRSTHAVVSSVYTLFLIILSQYMFGVRKHQRP